MNNTNDTPEDVTHWTDSRGKTIPIIKMHDDHIRNALKKINRTKDWRQEYFEPLARELHRRTLIIK